MRQARLRQARLEAGFTQAALARVCGVSPRAVARWEAGGAIPRPATARLISEATGREISWFRFYEQEVPA